jgi:hypothetical protein
MASAASPPGRSRRSLVWRWVLGVAAVLSASGAWTVPVSADGLMILRTALSLRLTGSFRLPPPSGGTWLDPYLFRTSAGAIPGVDFGYQPLGSLLRAALLAPVGLVPPGALRGRIADVVLQLLPVVLTALAIVPLAGLARMAGCGRREAPALAGALILGTFLGPLGRTDFQEPILVFLAVWALERVLAGRRLIGLHRREALALSGLLAGVALLAKPTAFVLVPALLFGAARPLRRSARAADFGALLAGFAPGLAAFFALNALRFGSPFDFGYRFGNYPPGAERLPLGWTFLRLTLLPNRGLLFFAPLLLLVFFLPLRDRLVEPLRGDSAAALIAAGGFFASNLWWWSWEGGFGWGPRLLAPAVALSIPWLAGSGRAWKAAAWTLALAGLVITFPAYLLDDGRIYARAAARGPGVPFGPVMPRHRDPSDPARVHPYQRVHYVPAEASWIEGPRVLVALFEKGARNGTPDVEKKDSVALRLFRGEPALHEYSGVGRLLFDDAEVASDVEPRRALQFARAAMDFGGPPVDARALSSMLLLRAGQPAEAARLCREALALAPGRADVRSNLALAERMLGSDRVK